MEYVLGALLLLVIPVAWTAAFFMVLGARSRITALELKVRQLEEARPAREAAAAQPFEAPPAAQPEPIQPETAAAAIPMHGKSRA